MFRVHPFIPLLNNAIGDVKGLRILDVGCKTGEKTAIMASKGADVYGIDPDVAAMTSAVDEGRIHRDKAFITELQNLPQAFTGTFDVATVWLFCINYNEREAYFNALASCIKPEGKVVMTVYDYDFMIGSASIMPVLNKYFSKVRCRSGQNWDKYIITCKGPTPVLSLAAQAASSVLEQQQPGCTL